MQHSYTTFREREKTRWDGGEAYLPLSVPPPLPPPPKLLQMKRCGRESREEEPQKTQSHSHSCSLRSRSVILEGITNRMQGLRVRET